MTGYWLYPALLSFLIVCVVLSEYHWLALMVLGYFFLRLFYLKNNRIFFLSFLLAAVLFVVTCLHQDANQTVLADNQKEFLIDVQMNTLKIDGNQLQFYGTITETKAQKISEKIVVFFYFDTVEEKEWWQSQNSVETLLVQGSLTPPEGNRNQYQFNYKQFLFGKKIHWILEANQLSWAQPKKSNPLLTVISIESMKQQLIKHIDISVTPKLGNYMKTLLLGDVGAFETDLLQDFKDLGLLHLLSISGLHIQFLFAGISYVLLRLGVTKETSYFVIVPMLFFYGTLIGWGTSTFRAVAASFILLTARRFNWKVTGLDAWSLTLLTALAIHPYQIGSVGFQLSYLLSLLLTLFSSTLLLPKKSVLLSNLWISFIMTVASIPVLMFHFFEFPWIGMIANVVFIPFFSWILVPLIGYLLLSFLIGGTVLFDVLLALFESVLTIPEWLAAQFSNIPYTILVTGRTPWFLLLLLGIVLAKWFMTLESRTKSITWAFISGLTLVVAVQWQTYSPFGEVIMIDVGQGDAILIKEPFGQGNFLIDTGGNVLFDVEEWEQRKDPSTVAGRTLIPVLKSKGVRSLNQVLITHGDADHVEALKELAKEIEIREVVFPEGTEHKELFYETARILHQKGVQLTKVLAREGHPLKLASSLYVLWPFESGQGGNGDSLVLYGKIGAYQWLFTGDIGEEEERKLLEFYPSLRADVLKVGHHGSRTSSSKVFLQRIRPKVALISARKNNRFGHPHSEVVDLLKQEQVSIYRTDKHGAIHYRYLPFPWIPQPKKIETILEK